MKKTKVKNVNNEKGITLVALVVTIIVLMILAGITLSLVLGQNGIIGKAQQAKLASANADKATADGLNNIENELELETSGIATRISDVSTIQDAIHKSAISVGNNVSLKDDEGNTVTIPAGFKIASDSATKQEDGIVIEDKDGNQYVWIPVANISNYARTDFGKYWVSYSCFSETMPSDEQTSVNRYHGYYIGRYEAGDRVSTANKTMRSSGDSVTNAVAIKKYQVPYSWVTKDQAQTLATGITGVEGYKATTKLCSSYAWDTAINFIQNKVANYGTSSPQGNYLDTTFSYIDITGATQTKMSNSKVVIPTGETTPECNIYDMGGNDWEWTTESCSYDGHPYVPRGGPCDGGYSDCPAGMRSDDTTTGSYYHLGFRVTLYM